jgi:sugar O-acyltransferase (sialic acid O-acetyltransferase NeuD family)
LGDSSGSPADLLRSARLADAPPVAIYGAALGGRVVVEYLQARARYRPAVFLDDSDTRPTRYAGLAVWGGHDLELLAAEGIRFAFVAIGRGRIRLTVMDRVRAAGLELLTIVHPSAFVAPSAQLSEGVLVKAMATIGTNCQIGVGAIVDNGAVVPHDNVIGAGALIAPGAALGSSITVGDRAVVGIGARIATAVRIGADAVIATGASVVRDVAAGDVVEGVPARVVGKVRVSR